jgi:hypothetical protein
MTTWRFSDGTTAELGGTIEGASLFAQELRAELEQAGLTVITGRLPGGATRLDRQDLALFDAWLKQELAKPSRVKAGLRMTERPERVPDLPKTDDKLESLIAEHGLDRDALLY